MNRLTTADLRVIYQQMKSFRHFSGVGALLDKIEAILAEDAGSYIKVAKIEFTADPPDPDLETVWINRLRLLGCWVPKKRPPAYAIQVPDHGADFDATIELIASLYNRGVIRYLG